MLLFILSITFNGFSQNAFQDKPGEDLHYIFKPVTLLRTGLGYQNSFYGELGFTQRNYFGDAIISGTKAYYGSFEWTPSFSETSALIYGIKLGFEIALKPFMLGVESKFQTTFTNNDFVITPKIGIGDGNFTKSNISYVYLCYGYNISFNNRPFNEIGRHQVSLLFNAFNLSYLLNKKRYSNKLTK